MSSTPTEQDIQEWKREQQLSREEQRHARQLRFDDQGRLSRDYLEAVLDADVLQENTIKMLQNYIDRNWVLSNRGEARAHDIFHKLRVTQIKIEGMHPPSESAIVGPVRAFLFDDESEELWPLTAAERAEIDSLFDSLRYALITRGDGGFERRLLDTEIRESRTESDTFKDNSGSGALRGLFR
jgi:hypothetical protein